MEYIHNLIWLCPLLFIAGFIDSIAGGGGLIALPAYMMCGMPIYYVYGLSLIHIFINLHSGSCQGSALRPCEA